MRNLILIGGKTLGRPYLSSSERDSVSLLFHQLYQMDFTTSPLATTVPGVTTVPASSATIFKAAIPQLHFFTKLSVCI